LGCSRATLYNYIQAYPELQEFRREILAAVCDQARAVVYKSVGDERFVEVKRVDQVDLQALHRIRDQMVGNRTKLICPMRVLSRIWHPDPPGGRRVQDRIAANLGGQRK
jgi:hypothetical protein